MGTHTHEHDSSTRDNQKRLLIALSITAFMTVIEIIGGVLSNSLALLGDAAHMFTDTLALGLSLLALRLAQRPANSTKTYGYLRAEILAALTNGTILLLISAYIFYEAYQRLLEPPDVEGGLMLGVAVIGLIANLIGISVLHSGSRHNLNVKGAFLHMLGDALSSLGVIVAGIIILVTDWGYADPIISILIGLLILKGALGLVLESVHILLEAVPKHLDMDRISKEIRNIDGVKDVHDVHLWTITSGVYAMSAHLLIDDRLVSDCAGIVDKVNGTLEHEFGIGHTTFQLECEECSSCPVCQIENHRR
ncbi:MAG: cation transporter [Chloroflexi bacterium]|jgi:cobalt-zinc-cadmium efflux system protein|nr:cation transporter [Chloroflexota bacterium]